MNRRKFERHLTGHRCFLHHHGGSHDTWRNADESLSSSIPRHGEIDPGMIRGICKQLGIPAPREK